jgi:hypothetical protein
MGKTNFNMQLTDVQKEIMDFVTEVIYSDYNYSKAEVVLELFREAGIQYLGLPEEAIGNDDDILLFSLKEEKMNKDVSTISFFGAEQYKAFIEDSKAKGNNVEYLEKCLAEFLKREKGVVDNG